MPRTAFDPQKAIDRFHASSSGRLIDGVDDTLVNYRRKRRQKTLIVRATWRHVLIYAMINAAAVSTTKAAIYHFFGKPVIMAAYEVEPQ